MLNTGVNLEESCVQATCVGISCQLRITPPQVPTVHVASCTPNRHLASSMQIREH